MSKQVPDVIKKYEEWLDSLTEPEYIEFIRYIQRLESLCKPVRDLN